MAFSKSRISSRTLLGMRREQMHETVPVFCEHEAKSSIRRHPKRPEPAQTNPSRHGSLQGPTETCHAATNQSASASQFLERAVKPGARLSNLTAIESRPVRAKMKRDRSVFKGRCLFYGDCI